MFDFHLHLARLSNPENIADELNRRGYHYVDVGCEPWEWAKVRDLNRAEASCTGKCAEVNCAAFGLHPMIAENVTEADFAKLREILESDTDAQVGEAGLDRRFPGYEPGGVQESVFRRQAELALELGRDLQIHCVGDYMRIVKVLREAGFKASPHGNSTATDNAPRPVFHRLGGDISAVRAGIELGAIFSLHKDSFRKKSTAAAIPLIPRDCVRFETDADETYCKACAVPTSAVPAKEIAEALIKDLGEVKRLYELAIKDA
jgi:TatD DNase family protein